MPDINKLLEEASDFDPDRIQTKLWAALDALAEDEGWHIPDPMVERNFTVTVTARFPRDHNEAQDEIARQLLGSFDGVGGDHFVHRVQVKIE